ncbi:MAG TPA: hypothetical protein VKB46_13995, partial [Pyrinomonadaceae bacterium]|nr:hypothetical protein [Pyrinomonadaceae bacterium]
HPRRRERANFADALAVKIGDRQDVSTVAPAQFRSLWGRTNVWWGGPRLAWAFSLLLLFLAAGAVWLVLDSRRLRQERAQAEAQRAIQAQRELELQQQVEDERRRVQQLSAELEQRHAEQGGKATPSPTSVGNVPAFVSLSLAAGAFRGPEGGPPATLVLPSGTQQVRLQLSLKEGNYSSYEAVLHRAGGEQISTWQHLAPKLNESGASFSLTIPAQRFISGDYILTLRGKSQGGEVEDLSKSIFHVERR